MPFTSLARVSSVTLRDGSVAAAQGTSVRGTGSSWDSSCGQRDSNPQTTCVARLLRPSCIPTPPCPRVLPKYWLRARDSNPDKQNQNLLSCRLDEPAVLGGGFEPPRPFQSTSTSSWRVYQVPPPEHSYDRVYVYPSCVFVGPSGVEPARTEPRGLQPRAPSEAPPTRGSCVSLKRSLRVRGGVRTLMLR